MWSWHYNWFPGCPVDPFDTEPGRNELFNPQVVATITESLPTQ
jgi:hypothetical protein